MKMLHVSRKTILGLLLILLTAASFCYGDQRTVEVVGIGECSDCQLNNIKNSHAFKGLRVTIDCKHANGGMKTRGAGELDEEGKFRVEFPLELVENGKLKEECYAQLHSASDAACPTHNGIESSKIAFVSESGGKHTFSPVGKLKFSPITCTSATFKPIPFHLKKPFFKKPLPHHVPIVKKPLLPLIPVHKKPLPHVPVFKKPLPTPIPIYKKSLPHHIPIYKKPLPHVPIFKKPPIPVYEPKPFPQPKFPPKLFEHPKLEKLPSLPHP